jgi:uncharacterized protein (DUF1800 family)
MVYSTRPVSILVPALLWVCFAATPGILAQLPGEVSDVRIDDRTTLTWSATSGAEFYNVYRGTLAGLAFDQPGRCHGYGISATEFSTPDDPVASEGFFYLVTGESAAGEGTPGSQTGPVDRALRGSCTPLLRGHVLNRLGFGGDSWTRDRIALVGFQGYVNEQLEPATVPEDLTYILGSLVYEPPADILELIGRQFLGAVHSHKQLQWQAAIFWANHFNTFWGKLADIFVGVYPPCDDTGLPEQCDPEFPAKAYEVASKFQYDEMNDFRDLTFGTGNFREILEASAMSPAMILYLDTYTSRVGNPNENYPRELMELYAMGVDGGYTQQDVEEVSRVFTGWTLCKRVIADLGDPLASCLEEYWLETPASEWSPVFVVEWHDCTAKTLFVGTPYEATIPNTCASPLDGVNDIALALDALAAHPSTARFISKKILQQFVTDVPDEELIEDLVAVWNDAANPNGIGDLHALISAALNHPAFLDPDRVGEKIKTPLEHFASAMRGIGGRTDGLTTALTFLVNAQHIPHYNPVPTGYPEVGEVWIDTNNYLERQNYGLAVAFLDTPEFGSNPIALLNANGVSTAPGNAEAIVDFFAQRLFGGALTPLERQRAIDYLSTDSAGVPSAYDDGRIRETVGFLLGYPQFQEQ